MTNLRLATLIALLTLAACAVEPGAPPEARTGGLAAEPAVLPDPPADAEDCDCGGDRPTIDGRIAEPACDTPPLPAPETTLDPVPIGDAPRLGPAAADVVVVFSADLQCGFCSRAHDTMKKLVDAYRGRVAVVYKHNPLPMHEHALAAAVAAEAARRQGKFWEMVDVLFAHQDRLDRDSLTEWARAIGLDARRFEADLDDPALAEAVRADQRVVQAHGGRGTPAFWIDGRRLVGAYPLETFRGFVDEALRAR